MVTIFCLLANVDTKTSQISYPSFAVMERESLVASICTKFRNETIDGIGVDILKSALQKYIRRGNVQMALWVACRLDLFCYVEGGKRIWTNFIHRLMIIFLEDIGFPGITHWHRIHEWLYLTCLRDRHRDRPSEIRAIRSAIILMCNSEKARTCGHLKAYMSVSIDQEQDVLHSLARTDVLGYAK